MAKNIESRNLNKKEAKLNVDENKEKIKINYMSFYRFFTHSKWTLITTLLNVFLISLSRVLEMLFSYYMLNWIKYISMYNSNNSSLLTDVIDARNRRTPPHRPP